jgi:potassium channel subfamily K
MINSSLRLASMADQRQLYFCDVTILTVGFGDLYLNNDVGRGFVFPYSVGGIIILGLVISSISKFAAEMSEDNVIHRHLDKVRSRTVERTVTDVLELERMETAQAIRHNHLNISAPFNSHAIRSLVKNDHHARRSDSIRTVRRGSVVPQVRKRTAVHEVVKLRRKKIILLREEKDRFDEMRRIQKSAARFKRWWALTLSVSAFATLWVLGAVVFWEAEKTSQQMSYFQALYFCYVSLLTIGYGDFAPKSNAGRSFFVVWSLIAVPTMTILISDMGATVIDSFKRGTFRFADFTVLPKEGAWRDWLVAHPRILRWLRHRKHKRDQNKRMKEGIPFPSHQDDVATQADENALNPNLDRLAHEVKTDEKKQPNESVLARRLALAIRKVAEDFKCDHNIMYTFEQWAEYTRLIRFTTEPRGEALLEEETGLIEWDWIGEDSPMMTNQSEPEFLLDRLTESLARYMRRAERRSTHAFHPRHDRTGLRRSKSIG